MKRLILVGLLAVANLANAECYVRSTTNITNLALGGRPTDIQKLVTNEGKVYHCLMRYRILVNNEWNTVEGTGTGTMADTACARALDAKQGYLLEEPVREKVHAKQELVCSDLPDIHVHAVRPGEIIWESETDMHRNPQERAYFDYKQSRCRMFTERNTRDGNFYTYQGVICQTTSDRNSKWQVVDKY